MLFSDVLVDEVAQSADGVADADEVASGEGGSFEFGGQFIGVTGPVEGVIRGRWLSCFEL